MPNEHFPLGRTRQIEVAPEVADLDFEKWQLLSEVLRPLGLNMSDVRLLVAGRMKIAHTEAPEFLEKQQKIDVALSKATAEQLDRLEEYLVQQVAKRRVTPVVPALVEVREDLVDEEEAPITQRSK